MQYLFLIGEGLHPHNACFSLALIYTLTMLVLRRSNITPAHWSFSGIHFFNFIYGRMYLSLTSANLIAGQGDILHFSKWQLLLHQANVSHFKFSLTIPKQKNVYWLNVLEGDCVTECLIIWTFFERHYFNVTRVKKKKVKLATVIEGGPKAPLSIATTPRCRRGRYSIPWIAPLYLWCVPYKTEC